MCCCYSPTSDRLLISGRRVHQTRWRTWGCKCFLNAGIHLMSMRDEFESARAVCVARRCYVQPGFSFVSDHWHFVAKVQRFFCQKCYFKHTAVNTGLPSAQKRALLKYKLVTTATRCGGAYTKFLVWRLSTTRGQMFFWWRREKIPMAIYWFHLLKKTRRKSASLEPLMCHLALAFGKLCLKSDN